MAVERGVSMVCGRTRKLERMRWYQHRDTVYKGQGNNGMYIVIMVVILELECKCYLGKDYKENSNYFYTATG